jgi:hypothetical protein
MISSLEKTETVPFLLSVFLYTTGYPGALTQNFESRPVLITFKACRVD